MRDKTKLLSSVPKEFSPSLNEKNFHSSSKKSFSPDQTSIHHANFSIDKGVIISSERQNFIETLKQKILYNQNTGLMH